jgi:hypothetical protein
MATLNATMQSNSHLTQDPNFTSGFCTGCWGPCTCDTKHTTGGYYTLPTDTITTWPYPDSTATAADGGTVTWFPARKIKLKCSKCKKKMGTIKATDEPEEVICETCRKIDKLKE